MVRKIVLYFMLSISVSINVVAQTDSLKCEKYFEHYDSLLSEKLIFLWDTPSCLKKSSDSNIDTLKALVKRYTNYDYVLVDVIIDSNGKPICFRFKQKLTSRVKRILIKELQLLYFDPALQNKKEVESIYTLKI